MTRIAFGFDTETELITDEAPIPECVCMSYAMGDQSGLLTPQEGAELLRGMLESEDTELVGHNLAFDFAVMCKVDPTLEPLVWAAYEAGRCFDTLAAAWLDDISRGIFQGARKGMYGLARLSELYLSEYLPKEDTYRLRYGELKGIPIEQWPQEAIDYAVRDASVALRVRFAMHEPTDTRVQSAHLWWLFLTSKHGITTDPERVGMLFDAVTEEAGQIVKDLTALGWVSFDKKGELHRHTKKVQDRMRACGVGKFTKKGNISVDAEACEASGDKDLIKYARLAKLLDVINKDLEYLAKEVVRCSYGLAETGRTTCWGPNLQNLKVQIEKLIHASGKRLGIRECFVPRPGHVFVGADYDGLELRTVAQACLSLLGYSQLAQDLNNDIDPHCKVAVQLPALAGTTYEVAKGWHDAGDDRIYKPRQTAKAANFGFPGGCGIARFIVEAKSKYDIDLTEDESREVKEAWFAGYSEFRDYFQMVNRIIESGLPIEQLFSGRLRGGCGFTDGANTFFQGLGGDATKAAGFALTKECRIGNGPLRGCHPVVYVHDEFLVECPEEKAQEVAKELERIMIEAASRYLPDVPPKTKAYLSRRWSKKAKRIVDAAGRLVPWEG